MTYVLIDADRLRALEDATARFLESASGLSMLDRDRAALARPAPSLTALIGQLNNDALGCANQSVEGTSRDNRIHMRGQAAGIRHAVSVIRETVEGQ